MKKPAPFPILVTSNRRRFLIKVPAFAVCAASAIAALFLETPAYSADTKHPNIVVMMTDDQRFDFMSCAGHPFLQTPNMDRIAKEGVRFRNMFVTNSLCAPSRATLMTGLYSHANGVKDNLGSTLDPAVTWMPDLLRAAGYDVAFCGKSHVPGNFRQKKWDYYFGFRGQGIYVNPRIAESQADGTIGPDRQYQGWVDDVLTDHAVAWMKRDRGEKPFCLFLFFKSPHRRWVPPDRYKDKYADVKVVKPALWDDPGVGKPRAFLQAANMIGQYPDTKDFDGMIRDYSRCLTGVDDNVGKVLKALEDKKCLDETAILYTSDNGFFLGEWQRFDKRFMHEPSIRVPLLLRYPPMVKAGTERKEMVLNVDIAPTLLALAGTKSPTPMHGRSLTDLFATGKAPWRDAWYYEYFEFPDISHNVVKHRGVRTEKYKFIDYYEPPFPKWREEFELYDLEKDPEERVNLYSRPAMKPVVEKLKLRMTELRKDLGEK
ncbi:MAG TPA: sulfatase [Fimbriiglobus sp.]|jgi:arylsulfatase A-like enzyme